MVPSQFYGLTASCLGSDTGLSLITSTVARAGSRVGPRQKSVYSNTAAVNISGCITSLLIIGESELLTKLAAEAGIPSESFASIRDVLLSRRNPSQQTNMLGGWRSPAAKAPRLPTKPEAPVIKTEVAKTVFFK